MTDLFTAADVLVALVVVLAIVLERRRRAARRHVETLENIRVLEAQLGLEPLEPGTIQPGRYLAHLEEWIDGKHQPNLMPPV